MELTERARVLFSLDRYATEQTGIEIDYVDVRCARCSVTLNARHRNAKGAVMGGVLFTLADLAFAVAAHSSIIAHTPNEEDVLLCWVSASANIHFVSAAKGDSLTAEAHCIREGRSRVLYQTEVHDSDGRLVAVVTTEGARI